MLKFIVAFLFSLIACSATAQNCTDDFLGTKTLYKDPITKYTPAPVGFVPVFINQVGRHGARHLTKDVNTSPAYQLLASADSNHMLTPKGEKLHQMVIALDKVEKGNTKSISEEGRTELAGIGERMYHNYPQVFKSPVSLKVALTKEIRTKQSADAFLAGLEKNAKVEFAKNEFNDDTDLRFYDFSKVYKNYEEDGPWIKNRIALEKKVNIETINNEILEGIFKNEYLKSLNTDDAEKFISDIYGFAAIVFSLQDEVIKTGFKPQEVDFIKQFTCRQIEALSTMDLADDYYKKGPGIDVNGIQVRIAAPLLVNFIKTSDEFVKGSKVNAQLRFAHAETISPIAALMGISFADKDNKDIAHFGQDWSASKVIPLSSNIQWIFFKKAGSDKLLVKILLNEKEAHITGIKDAGFPYYNWDELRALYMKKLNSLNVKLDDNMMDYLIKLR